MPVAELSVEHEKFVRALNQMIKSGKNIQRIIHINCGTGSYYKLCRKSFPDIEYIGYASSEESRDACRSNCDHASFFHRDYDTLDEVLWMDTDLLVLSIENDPTVETDQVLGPNFPNVIIPKIKLSQENQEEALNSLMEKGYEYIFYLIDSEKSLFSLSLSRIFVLKDKEDDKSF